MLRAMSSRELQLPDSWKRRLVHLRVLSGTLPEPTLDAREVATVERELGRQLGDGLLALVANRDDKLVELDIRLGALVTHTQDAHEAGMPRGLVGLGRRPDHNVLYGTSAMGTSIHRLDLATGDIEQIPTETFLDRLIGDHKERLRDAQGKKRARAVRVVKDEDIAKFKPAIVTDESQMLRVTHAKFGAGEVLEEREGRVTVRFEDGATRTLLRSFLTEV